ncbi:MAG: anthranilate synthase component I [Candidatus Melainabacteria bacterium HGW-Melainabacteria-1]|nr:MAG: anthranilate synthase component I [Candidatus Melainabacteria bacterium HGW-Melainabacteria-1]
MSSPTGQPARRLLRRMPADTLTPLAALLRLRQDQPQSPAFLFESAGSDLEQARYSFLGLNPSEVLTLSKGVLSLAQNGTQTVLEGPPLELLKARLEQDLLPPDPEFPPFCGGYVGYLGYDIVSQLEAVPPPQVPSPLPDACVMRLDRVLVFDHLKRQILLLAHLPADASPTDEAVALAELDQLQHRLRTPVAAEALLVLPEPGEIPELSGGMGQAAYCAKVETLKQAIHEGEIFQAVLAEQFRAPYAGEGFNLYRVLRSLNPSPYLFYLDTGNEVLLGASPELLLKSDGHRIATCPIAGTRRRGRTRAEDRQLAEEMQHDEKERAEHLMLVDLGRNDLGRVAKPGSVEVSRYLDIEYFSHVMHLVSLVEAELDSGKTSLDALLACFPAGTLSGAPKIRAMQLLAELEPVGRGWYGGAVFYHGFDGQLDACITIRSLAIKDGEAILQAGAGIVADSVPELEYKEVRNKARVMFQTLQLAQMAERAAQEAQA